MPAPPTLAAGAVVGGKYLLLRRIGAGGMGQVWVAKNQTTGAEVAVKMPRTSAVREDSARRFRHEARLGAMLTHRGVVRIFDLVEQTDGTLLLVMELLRGETLERYLQRRGFLPAREAIAIVVPVLLALGHAHDTGIVHRDVTPANIFLAIDPDGHVTPKLLDFGIAKLPAANVTHTIEGRALGTPRYMAPERIRDSDAIDARSDLFSVGVVLYEALTGTCPFAATSPAASLAAVLEVVVDPDPRIDPRIWIELRRALSKRPYERQTSAVTMASALLSACGETEASLSDVLRQASLWRDLPLTDELPEQPALTADGHSLGPGDARATPTRRRAVAWIAGATVSLASSMLLGASLHHRASETATVPPPRPSSEDVPIATVDATPTVEAVPTDSPAMPSASVAPSPTKNVRHPAHPFHPKAVATTPGF